MVKSSKAIVAFYHRSVTAWYIQAVVNNSEVVFKVGTGLEVTAISKKIYDAIGHPTCQQACSADQIDSLWIFWAELQ